MIDEIGRDELVRAVARAALLGARGNCGVILSQIVRGAAEELASRPGELVDPMLVSAAFARAADAAYESVRDPAEGTMLSAVRAMAHRVAQDLAHMEKASGSSRARRDAEQDELLAEVLERALEAGKEAVERGPEQLAVLREAGRRRRRRLRADRDRRRRDRRAARRRRAGARAPAAPAARDAPAPARVERVPLLHELRGHRRGPRRARLRAAARGDRRLACSSSATRRRCKVHVHTDEPDLAVAIFVAHGEVSRFDVADMREQVAERTARLGEAPRRRRRVRASRATATGSSRLYRELGAHVVDGGATMNPSTYDLLAGIHAAAAREASCCRTART